MLAPNRARLLSCSLGILAAAWAVAQQPAGAPAPAAPAESQADFLPLPDRWRLDFPDWDRYTRGKLADPYNRNVLKGDYPLFGQKTFFVVTGVSDTLGETRRLPVPSDVSSQNPDSEEFFGNGRQYFFLQEVLLTLSLFHGDAAFRPRDWELRVTPVGSFNYLHAEENGIVNIDVRKLNTRTDRHVGLQEAFGEVKLFDVSPYYDITSLRVGIQGFTSDFRGFVFSDNQLGARFFGNFGSNRFQWNIAAFDMLEKDTNSGLNTIHTRNQHVGIGNFFAQDFLVPGYTTQLSILYNDDKGPIHYDENGFLVRPAPIGDVTQHRERVGYIGWTGEGHIGRLNISHAAYEAYGDDERDPIAGRKVRVNAQMAALELSVDVDWWRPLLSFFWSSGDANPTDGTARGFSAILDNTKFLGGPNSFWNRQGIALTQTGVKLVSPNSVIPDLRSSKDEGQAEYVNPGIFEGGLTFDFQLTPKLKLEVLGNALWFHHTQPLELLLFQPNIRREIGQECGLGVTYRPFLNQQVILTAGAAAFFPGTGFKDIYTSNCSGLNCGAKSKTLYQGFMSLIFAY